jgi:coenzyme F420 hydrogenase subunit beta
MSSLPLKKSGSLVQPFKWPMEPASDPPRALKTLARIVDNGLCHRCGSCIGICPTDVLSVDKEEYPVVNNLSACTDCDLCVKVCPGDEFSVPSIAKQLFNNVPDIKDMHGHFIASYLGYSTDGQIRENSTSGGLVTGLLTSLLQQGVIDGAVVIGSDENILWKGKPMIARTKEEIIASAKSKYAISPTNVMFSEIRKTEGRYALVGLPCQIHGFHKAARLDKRLKERVAVTIGLFCHAAVEHEPMEYLWDRLGEDRKNVAKFVSRIGKHPGSPHIVYKDGSAKPVYFPEKKGFKPNSMEMINILYRLYTPERCLTCYDSTSEFADIAVGDPWMASPSDDINFYEGYSFSLARTELGNKFLLNAKDRGDIKLVQLRHDIARSSNTLMGEEKRWRAFRIIETRRRQGLPVPDYNIDIPRASGKQLILTELNMLSHVFCFFPKAKIKVLKFVLSPVGYYLLWLNNKKRRFRNWRRDTLARLLRPFSRDL